MGHNGNSFLPLLTAPGPPFFHVSNSKLLEDSYPRLEVTKADRERTELGLTQPCAVVALAEGPHMASTNDTLRSPWSSVGNTPMDGAV